MKKHIVIMFSLLFLLGCNNIDYNPKYKDFKNDWERENLGGKVSKLKQYTANVSNLETGETEKSLIVFEKKFTPKGDILYQKYFNTQGKLIQYTKNTFNNKGFRIKTVSENSAMKTIEKLVYDTITGKKIAVSGILNNSVKYNVRLKYNKEGNIIKTISITKGDTTINSIKYKYDNKKNIVLKKKIAKNSEQLTEYKYDKIGNVIELVLNSVDMNWKYYYEYDNENRIRKIAEFESEELKKETVFDRFYNKTLVRFFLKGKLAKEMSYKYKFDSKGNWVKRDVVLKETMGKSKAIPVFTETRKIEYYK